ncbi:hypothetical protein KFE25_009006 [Diacronema lutheri]|uniref:Uncharacterized protein n=2 Tax=Diacronema lutheri TaxID=2081491 RepID=A0A8J6CHT1_DIALT|nr:hypothetical protein KFE25_009006 [Diacronema lutheri]
MEHLQLGVESESRALEALEEVIDGAMRVVREREEEEASIAYCTKRSSQDIMGIIEWYAIDCDRGEPELGLAETWLPDEEPPPAVTDAWSRSALSAHTRQPIAAPTPGQASAMLELPLGARLPARATPRKPRGQADKSSVVSDASNLGKLQDLDSIPPPTQPARRQVAKPQVEVDPWTRAAQQRARRAAAEAAELERVSQVRKEARGKNYTYDHLGKVVLVQPPDGEKLPAFRTSPAVGVAERAEARPIVPAPPRGPPRGAPRGAAAGGARAAGRLSGARALDEAGVGSEAPPYRPLDSEQPALMPSLSLQPGVTLFEAGGTKQQGRPMDAKHLSLREFAAIAEGHARTPASRPADGSAKPLATSNVVQPGTLNAIIPRTVAEPRAASPPNGQERHALINRSVGAPPAAGAFVPPAQPKGRLQVDLTLGARSRLPRERPPLASKPLDDWDPARTSPGAGRLGVGSGALPVISPLPSRGSVLGPVRGSFERRQPADVVSTPNPNLLSSLLFAGEVGDAPS